MPKEQRSIGYMMAIISPIFIMYISITSASALGLYWTINAAFLIVQMFFSNKYYSKLATEEANQLEKKFKVIIPKIMKVSELCLKMRSLLNGRLNFKYINQFKSYYSLLLKKQDYF